MTGFGSKFFVGAILSFALANASFVIESKESIGNLQQHEDASLSPMELIKKYGYNGEIHRVTTDDKYILEMHRITGNISSPNAEGKTPILILHALLSSSVDWIITGPTRAFAYALVDAGYDVWLGNFRGNRFSRKHAKLTDHDKEYWQFSWHESGMNDLPSMIDYILEKTKKEQLIYVGHSQGSTAFWVMASMRPEYQKKVKAMFALAPVAYLNNMKSPFYRVLAKFGNNIEKMMTVLGHYEFEPSGEFLKKIAALGCDDESWSQPICTNVIFLIAGYGSDHLNKTMLPVMLAHTPAGGSVKQVIHFVQLARDHQFRQYDHGKIGNILKYKRLTPPVYDLSKVTLPVYLHYAENDWLADPKDVSRLYRELGNPVAKFQVPDKTFGHLDFMWAKDAKELLYEKIIVLMKKLNN